MKTASPSSDEMDDHDEEESPQVATKATISVKKSNRVKYKKAPGAPRRFKSAYMFFSTEKHRSIREELAAKGTTEKTTSIAKMVSKAWKALSQSERDAWEERASQDKARYEVEKTMYTGPWKVPAKKRAIKDPNAPKRPMSAFLSFSHAKRAEVKEANPNLTNAEISRVLAQLWKDAAENDKKTHIDQEFSLRQEYKSAIAVWRENSEREMFQQRKVREDMALRTVAANNNKSAAFTGRDEHLHDNPNDGPSLGTNDAVGFSYPPSHYSQYPQEMYPPPYGAAAPPYFQPYSGTGADPRDGAGGYPTNDGYPPPYGFYPSYGSDAYGPPGAYGVYGAGGHTGAYHDYPPPGPNGYPSYYSGGHDSRFGHAEEAKFYSENRGSPARNPNDSMPQGRLHTAAKGGRTKHS